METCRKMLQEIQRLLVNVSTENNKGINKLNILLFCFVLFCVVT